VFVGGITHEKETTPVIIGSIEEYLHVFVGSPTTTTIAKAIQRIQGGSSKFMDEAFPNDLPFAWQEKHARQ